MKHSVLVILLSISLQLRGRAQDPISLVISKGISKVIRAVDLKIQRLQTKTIWLQNVQKQLENEMSQFQLSEITGWVRKQKELYASYFEELWKVKEGISSYYKVVELFQSGAHISETYRQLVSVIGKDSHFSAGELLQATSIAQTILKESLKTIKSAAVILNPWQTQMTDQDRIHFIDELHLQMLNYSQDLDELLAHHRFLSIQRIKEQGDIETIKKLYGTISMQ